LTNSDDCEGQGISPIFGGGVMVFNATFNNISVILEQSIFYGGENQNIQKKP
jgi:hypothetical protein